VPYISKLKIYFCIGSFIKSWVIGGKKARTKAKAAASNLSFDEQCTHCEKVIYTFLFLDLCVCVCIMFSVAFSFC